VRVFGLSAYRVYLMEAGASAFFRSLIYTVLAVYYVQTVGMNPLQLVLVGTTIEATCFLFQVPTGVIADLHSRRLSVVIGEVLVGVGFVVEGMAPLFVAILVAEVVRGVGETCIDGALQAWIADEHGEEQLERVFLRAGQVAAVAWIVGPLVSVGLATIDLRVPILLGAVSMIGLGLFLRAAMAETGFRPAPREERGSLRASVGSMVATTRQASLLVRGRPVLMLLLAVGVVYGAYSEGYDRLWEAQFLTTLSLPAVGGLDPVVWFGLFSAGSAVIGIVASEVVVRRLAVKGDARTAKVLLGINVALVAGVVAFGLAPSFGVALAAFWLVGLARALYWPIAGAWQNRQIDSRVRATVISAQSQADALGQLAGGPAIGAVGNLFGLRAAITAAGLLLTPALVLYGRAVRRADGVAIDSGAATTVVDA
jgi:DHA3 family tetracycline resistance protein-like MFS transporter